MRQRLRLLALDLADWFAEDKTRVYDLTALAGVALVAIGVWCIYPPAALMLVGLAIAGVGILGAKVWARGRQRERRDREGWGE